MRWLQHSFSSAGRGLFGCLFSKCCSKENEIKIPHILRLLLYFSSCTISTPVTDKTRQIHLPDPRYLFVCLRVRHHRLAHKTRHLQSSHSRLLLLCSRVPSLESLSLYSLFRAHPQSPVSSAWPPSLQPSAGTVFSVDLWPFSIF